jgi:hypothetical protein
MRKTGTSLRTRQRSQVFITAAPRQRLHSSCKMGSGANQRGALPIVEPTDRRGWRSFDDCRRIREVNACHHTSVNAQVRFGGLRSGASPTSSAVGLLPNDVSPHYEAEENIPARFRRCLLADSHPHRCVRISDQLIATPLDRVTEVFEYSSCELAAIATSLRNRLASLVRRMS